MAKAIFEAPNNVDNPCVLFSGYYDKRTGYGVKRSQGKLYKAHRLVYMNAYGEVDRKTHIDHQCHNEALANGNCKPGVCTHRRCVNVSHLRAVSASENFRSGGNGLENRTHCKSGHLIAEVGIWEHNGWRQCMKCRKTSSAKAQKAYRERQAK